MPVSCYILVPVKDSEDTFAIIKVAEGEILVSGGSNIEGELKRFTVIIPRCTFLVHQDQDNNKIIFRDWTQWWAKPEHSSRSTVLCQSVVHRRVSWTAHNFYTHDAVFWMLCVRWHESVKSQYNTWNRSAFWLWKWNAAMSMSVKFPVSTCLSTFVKSF